MTVLLLLFYYHIIVTTFLIYSGGVNACIDRARIGFNMSS